MLQFTDDVRKEWWSKRVKAVVFCLIGLCINLALSKIVELCGLPLYIDNVGTLLTAFLGGYVPGAIVGYLTNVVKTFYDATSAYYGSLSVLIAVLGAYLYRRGWFRRVTSAILGILAFAVVGGCLGFLVTVGLYGFDFSNGVTSSLGRLLYERVINDAYWAQFTADFLLDILDKGITVVIVLIILRLLPESARRWLDIHFWYQKPLTVEEVKEIRGDKRKVRARSLRFKIIALFGIALLIIAVVTTGISFTLFHNATIQSQCNMADGLLNAVMDAIDPDKVDDYIEHGHAAEGYDSTEAVVISLRDSSPDIEYVYAYRILEDGCQVVFDPDTEDTPGAEPGEMVDFDESFSPYLEDLIAGRPIEPVISNDTYGWLLTLYKPIYDSTGACTCYVAADIAMGELLRSEFGFLIRVVSLFIGFFVLIMTLAVNFTESMLILPINTMTWAAERVAFQSGDYREDSISYLKNVKICTGDEIENLYHAILTTSEDMLRYLTDMNQKNETISRMQTRLIEVMADLVESRDQFTGDHVRHTARYCEIIMKKMREEGLYADRLTDEFINDVVHSAPLHDVGKITVSDTILNKPGKLTDEEFAVMKNHTLAGKEIIQSAADAVSEAGYLAEAENLAAYHHEKWNGKGYPCGLAGEEIPLSARIMAVADVFDALVSRRSYKEGFPIEKALDIIREGSGSHFDPLVARAFLDSEEEVRQVVADNNKKK